VGKPTSCLLREKKKYQLSPKEEKCNPKKERLVEILKVR
jgi:hypothetical protein